MRGSLLLALMLCAACEKYGSVNPVAGGGNRVTAPSLTGHWRSTQDTARPSEGNQICLTIEAPKDLAYQVLADCPEDTDSAEVMLVHLTRLGGRLVADVVGQGDAPEGAFMTHIFYPLRLAGDSLWVWPLNDHRLDSLLTGEPSLLAHVRPEEQPSFMLLAASSEELRAFFEQYLPQLLGDSVLLLREAAP